MKPARLLCLCLLIAACQRGAESGIAPPSYLRLADHDDVPTLDPARGYDTTSWQFEEMVFNTLVDYDATGNLVGELARDWEISDDGRSVTFRLQPGVTFSSGQPLRAEDVRYGIERVLDPRSRSPGAEFFRGIVGAEECRGDDCHVRGIEVINDRTMRFLLEAVDPLFLHKLAMPFAAAVPRREVERWGEDFGRHPVGSGPFVLRTWRSGEYLLLARNPHYFHADVPRLEGVVRFVGISDDLAWLKYESGQLDVANIPPAEFPRVTRTARYQPLLRHVTNLRTNYLGMNCALAPFSDRRVRQALSHAVNKEKLLRLINNRGVVAHGILPPGMPGANPRLTGYGFDPGRARELLAAAGYPRGFASTLWVRAEDTTLRLAQSIQQDLADIGVHVRLKPLAWGPFLEAVKRVDLVPLFLLGWEADFPDPSNFLEVLFHSKYIGTNNNTNYRNPEIDARLDTAAHASDPGARAAALQAVEALLMDDAPWVPLFHPVSYEIVSPRVRDFALHPLRPARFERTWLAPPAETGSPAE